LVEATFGLIYVLQVRFASPRYQLIFFKNPLK